MAGITPKCLTYYNIGNQYGIHTYRTLNGALENFIQSCITQGTHCITLQCKGCDLLKQTSCSLSKTSYTLQGNFPKEIGKNAFVCT